MNILIALLSTIFIFAVTIFLVWITTLGIEGIITLFIIIFLLIFLGILGYFN